MMDFKIEDIFTGYKRMIMDLKKPSYEANMKEFRGERGQFADDMLKHVKASPDKAAACAELGKAFADEAHEVFSRVGRIKGRMQADINLFMIYYVFPAILLTGDEEADRLCTGMKEAWNARFSDTNISYTTYDKLYDSFNEKIFGMF